MMPTMTRFRPTGLRLLCCWIGCGNQRRRQKRQPLISDPGEKLVAAAIAAGHRVVPLPGASAVVASLVASGLAPMPFTFLGFLPREACERDRLLATFRERPETLVLFESPRRVAATLRALAARLGDRAACVAREVTKVHEEFARGTLAELAERFASGARGEVTIVVAGARDAAGIATAASRPASQPTDLAARIAALTAQGRHAKEIAAAIAAETGISKREAYASVISARDAGKR
jgi:16S rRNA (cytidine1402-2'-O)-methyltransferase